MAVRFSVVLLLSLLLTFVKKGDDALAGRDERNIASHRFPPDATSDRTFKFQGLYISVFNEETQDRKTLEENVTEYKDFEVPKGYTTYALMLKRGPHRRRAKVLRIAVHAMERLGQLYSMSVQSADGVVPHTRDQLLKVTTFAKFLFGQF
ncbi:hypothetical protein BBAD15_g10077 [Beauveria bassiana D1-5]|uniref:Uncharacterized protein n=1 Tax=Beauveria bassiana D1-5 TaxID=1245745 RepID=A0A0A2VA02_BEABA|nr:hypothetical protein BBAD15_g10077 [Beauveria bassiana D1-5]